MVYGGVVSLLPGAVWPVLAGAGAVWPVLAGAVWPVPCPVRYGLYLAQCGMAVLSAQYGMAVLPAQCGMADTSAQHWQTSQPSIDRHLTQCDILDAQILGFRLGYMLRVPALRFP